MKKAYLLELLTVTLLIVVCYVIGVPPEQVWAAEYRCVESEELDGFGQPVIEELVITGSCITLSGESFRNRQIRSLHYDVSDMVDLTNEPFEEAKIEKLTIGEHVERIPGGLFQNARLYEGSEEENPNLTVHCSVGKQAFFNAFRGNAPHLVIGDRGMEREIQIGEYAFQALHPCALASLRIEENVVEIGDYAFADLRIGTLEYGARDVGKSDVMGVCSFGNSTLDRLIILDGVRVIRTNLFYGVGLQQEVLVIPGSVEWMGEGVFQEMIDVPFEVRSLVFEQGDVGHELYLNPNTFTRAGDESYRFESVRMEVVRAEDGWKEDVEGEEYQFPVCEKLYIHQESDFREYFVVGEETEVCLLCEEMEPVTGLDHMKLVSSTEVREEERQLVLVTEVWKCEVCGYERVMVREAALNDVGEHEPEPEIPEEPVDPKPEIPEVPEPELPQIPVISEPESREKTLNPMPESRQEPVDSEPGIREEFVDPEPQIPIAPPILDEILEQGEPSNSPERKPEGGTALLTPKEDVPISEMPQSFPEGEGESPETVGAADEEETDLPGPVMDDPGQWEDEEEGDDPERPEDTDENEIGENDDDVGADDGTEEDSNPQAENPKTGAIGDRSPKTGQKEDRRIWMVIFGCVVGMLYCGRKARLEDRK